jgi:hypothetical protein
VSPVPTAKVKLLATGIVVTAVAGLATVGALARFTDTDTVTANTLTGKTVSLTLDDYTSVVSATDMVPGDSVTAPIVVTNAAGSAALRYSITSSATDSGAFDLKDQLVFTVRTVDVTTPGTPCDNFDGTQLYTGDLDSTNGKIVGDSTQGYQATPGGGDRALGVGGSETLCFRVALPIGTSNDYKSLTTTATFTFDSEQTANN